MYIVSKSWLAHKGWFTTCWTLILVRNFWNTLRNMLTWILLFTRWSRAPLIDILARCFARWQASRYWWPRWKNTHLVSRFIALAGWFKYWPSTTVRYVNSYWHSDLCAVLSQWKIPRNWLRRQIFDNLDTWWVSNVIPRSITSSR